MQGAAPPTTPDLVKVALFLSWERKLFGGLCIDKMLSIVVSDANGWFAGSSSSSAPADDAALSGLVGIVDATPSWLMNSICDNNDTLELCREIAFKLL